MEAWQGLTDEIKSEYAVVRVIKKTSEKEILLLQNKKDETRALLRNYPGELTSVYQLLEGKQLTHIPQIIKAQKKDVGFFVLEEFLEGKILSTEVGSVTQVLDILHQVCDALTELHKIGVVHRDVKPENLMQTEEGKVYLIDLDAARIYKNYIENDTCALGTTGYAAPEQFGITQSDHRADIFALGVTLNVLLTGAHPSQHLCKGWMRHIVLKCTQIDPKTRYQSAAAVWKDAVVLLYINRLQTNKKYIILGSTAVAVIALTLGTLAWNTGTEPEQIAAESEIVTQTQADKSEQNHDSVTPVPNVTSEPIYSKTPEPTNSPKPTEDMDMWEKWFGNRGETPQPTQTILPDVSLKPTIKPTATIKPDTTAEPSVKPSATPSKKPKPTKTPEPSKKPKPTQTTKPTAKPTYTPKPTTKPTATPKPEPTKDPNDQTQKEGYQEVKDKTDAYYVARQNEIDAHNYFLECQTMPYYTKHNELCWAVGPYQEKLNNCVVNTAVAKEELERVKAEEPENQTAISQAQQAYDNAQAEEQKAREDYEQAEQNVQDYIHSAEYLVNRQEEDRRHEAWGNAWDERRAKRAEAEAAQQKYGIYMPLE